MDAVVKAVPRILAMEVVEGTPGAVGSIVRITTQLPDGEQATNDVEVVEMREPHTMVSRLRLPEVTSTGVHTFVERGGDTEYISEQTLETLPVNARERFMLRMTKNSRRKAAQREFDYELDCKNTYFGRPAGEPR
jgi:hypothetical protein